ncbi:MAG: SDR family oxidoreductase [Alphaproteobacteria bacterium]|nr:SDR family oxidoreductase [Alphaproteobacteria bacterium]
MKRIILIGGSDGLGHAFAELCAASGIEIVNLSRTPSDAATVNIKCDLSRESDINAAVNEIKSKYSEFSAIVNSAAIVGMEKINEITWEKFNKTWVINAIGPLYLMSQLFDNIKRNSADILNIGTTAILKEGYENQLGYLSSKWGLLGGSQNLRLELKGTLCRVIHAHVGGMNTRLHYKDYGATIDDDSDWMNPKDVAVIMLRTLQQPKQIEITEITIARKKK